MENGVEIRQNWYLTRKKLACLTQRNETYTKEEDVGTKNDKEETKIGEIGMKSEQSSGNHTFLKGFQQFQSKFMKNVYERSRKVRKDYKNRTILQKITIFTLDQTTLSQDQDFTV